MMIYLAKVILTDGKADIAKEVVTSLPPEKAAQDPYILIRATRGMSETKKAKLKVKSVSVIKPINGLQ